MKILALSIGNTSLFGGVYSGSRLAGSFRAPVREAAGRGFNRHVASRVRGRIDAAVICSVGPPLTPGLSRRVARAFGIRPLLLTVDAPHGIRIDYRDPARFGADRLAAAIGATTGFPS